MMMMKKEQQPQATGQKEEEEEDQEEEQRKGKGAAMVETSADVQRRHHGFLQRRREAQRQQHPRPFFLFGGRRPKEPDMNDDDPMVGTSLVVPSPRSSQPRGTSNNGADDDDDDDDVDQNDLENPPPPAVVDQQQSPATTMTQQQQQPHQLVPGAYHCRNTMSTSIAMSSMSDLSESIQFFTTTTTTAPNSHSSSSSSPHPLHLSPVVYNNTSPLPHTNNVPEIILPTAVEVIEEENASFSLGNHHHNNKRRTQCLFAVMVLIICALAVALGVSLSGDNNNSGNNKSGSSGGTALTSPPPPDVEISNNGVPSHQPDGGGGPAAGTAAGSINGTNQPAPVFVSVITGDNNNNNNHDDNLIAGDFNSDFGESVSLCGDGSRVAVAAPNAGLVQVFDLPNGDTSSGGTVQQVGQNITQEVSFEWSKVVRTSIVVELSADCRVLAIGTPFAKVPQQPQQQQDRSDFNLNDSDPPDNGNNFMKRAGQVKLYRYDETLDSWEPLGAPHTIRGQADGQHAGAAISLSRDGGMLAVGFPGDDEWNNNNNSSKGDDGGGAVGRNIGMVKVFRLSGEDWIQLGMPLHGRFDGQGFGGSVSLATLPGGSHVVAIGSSTGATGNDNTVAADVFLFERGEWIRRGREIVPELESLVGKEMAWFVQLSANGRTLVISNLYVNYNGVAIRDDDNAGLYVAAFELVESSSDTGDDDDDDDDHDNWVRIGNNIHQNKAGPKSGYIISLSQDGTRIGMGDPGTEDNGQGLKGHAHFYELVVDGQQQKQWCQFGPDINGDAPGDMAGFAVSVSGNGKRMAIGYPKSRAKGLTHGIIRVFDIHDEGVVPNCDT